MCRSRAFRLPGLAIALSGLIVLMPVTAAQALGPAGSGDVKTLVMAADSGEPLAGVAVKAAAASALAVLEQVKEDLTGTP